MPAQLTDELWDGIAPHLPVHPPSPKGGRPRVSDRDSLVGILFVLSEGIGWQALPPEMGCGSGSTCWRRFHEWTVADVWKKAHRQMVQLLGEQGLLNLEREVIDCASVRAIKGGHIPAQTRRIVGKMAVNAT